MRWRSRIISPTQARWPDALPCLTTSFRGQEFKVELKSYPGSGAVWRYASPDGPQLISETTQSQDESIGAAATQVFTLRADTPGSYNLVFQLKRAWESSPR